MLERGKISPRQMGETLFMTMLVTSILFMPDITVGLAGQAAWMSIFAGALLGIVTLALATWLGHKHAGQTLFQLTETVLGKWLGKYVGLMYVLLFIRIVAISARIYADYLSTSFMPQTPISVFILSLIFLTAWAALGGLEIIARMSEFIILLVVASLLAITLLSTQSWELSNLLPLLPRQGLLPILKASLLPEVWKGETIAVAVILPFITRPKRAFISGATAVVAASSLLALGVIGSVAIFGPDLVSQFRFPIHLFVRTINIGDILTRFEVIVMVAWIAGVFIKATFFHYCAALGLAQILGLSDYRPLVVPLGIVMATYAFLLFGNIVEVEQAFSKPNIATVIRSFALPLVLIIITLIREKLFGTDFTGGKQK